MKKLLHVGCANRYYEGFINSDITDTIKGKKNKVDVIFDLGEPWPFENESIDGIVGMHTFQQLHWRGLVVAFREAYRVLKPGGVLRMGNPMVEIMDKDLDYLLGWNNVTLFSFDLLKIVLVDRIGFSSIRKHWFRRGAMPELSQLDNRHNRGSHYIETIK